GPDVALPHDPATGQFARDGVEGLGGHADDGPLTHGEFSSKGSAQGKGHSSISHSPLYESPCLTGYTHAASCASPWQNTTSTFFRLRVSRERETRRSDDLRPATSRV